MPDIVMVIEKGEMPRIRGRGRRKGDGPNLRLLAKLKAGGDGLWGVPRSKMLSIRQSARNAGIEIKVREVPSASDEPSGTYVIQKVSE